MTIGPATAADVEVIGALRAHSAVEARLPGRRVAMRRDRPAPPPGAGRA
ncbi:MAG TPA: hypothetical protein VFP61_03120 [Acidimicrobiales bacterium]|nr:hypothetical protein [Acidimicrobiales bacterium]